MAVATRRADEELQKRRLERNAPRLSDAPPQRRGSLLVSKLLPLAGDAFAVSAAMVLALVLRSHLPGSDPSAAEQRHLLLATLSLPVWLAVFAHQRLYATRCVASRLEEFRRIVNAVAISVFAIASLGFMAKLYVSRAWLILNFAFAVGLVTLEREVIRRGFARARRRGKLLRPVVIVGRNAEGLALSEMLATDRSLGYDVVGFVDDDPDERAHLFDRPVLGGFDDTLEIVQRAAASGVIIATTAVDLRIANRLARQLTDAGIHVEMSSSLQDISADRLTVRPLGRFPVMYLEPVRRTGWRPVAKRTFDVALSGLILVLAAPLLAATALAVKLTSRGPVLFRQRRVGLYGRSFEVLKFRTMVADAEQRLADVLALNEADGPLFKVRNDPRITRVGRLLRKLSIDELPQFINVLRGDMSVVGPRPALVSEVRAWDEELHQRLRVKPGITGMWQVNGRSDASFETYTRFDLYYVDNWSLASDLAIVAKTVPTVLFGRGSY